MEPNIENGELQEQSISNLMRVRIEKLNNLQKSGNNPFDKVKYDVNAYSKDIIDNFEEYENKKVTIAGRIMLKRGQGKAGFYVIMDSAGRIQLYIKQDEVGQAVIEEFFKLDIGDIIGVEGIVFRTHKGEITVRVESYTLLTKSLRPLPEKFHGLKDVDTRYRQRYVDLIMNPEVKETFIKRTKIIKAIRKFLDDDGFMEVETPILAPIASGAAARPFLTHSNSLDMDLYLRIAFELYLKKLVVGGFDKVYDMGKIFRNEGIDTKHNPEFTMIELYQAYTDYNGMMDLLENLISYCVKEVARNN